MFTDEMTRVLEADGEKLRQLTGEDHGPWCPRCLGEGGMWLLVWDAKADEESGEFSLCPDCHGSGRPQKQRE